MYGIFWQDQSIVPTDELGIGDKGRGENLVKVIRGEESRKDPRFWSWAIL